MMKDTVLALQK